MLVSHRSRTAAPLAKLWILSELYLEALSFPAAFCPDPPPFDVLVVAGDVCQSDPGRAFPVLRRLAGNKPVVLVMGRLALATYFDGRAEERTLIQMDTAGRVISG